MVVEHIGQVLSVRRGLLFSMHAFFMLVHACFRKVSLSQSFARDVEEKGSDLFQLSSRLDKLKFTSHLLNVLPRSAQSLACNVQSSFGRVLIF